MKRRTKQFALRIVGVYRVLSRTRDARDLARQLLRAGTSVGANYRAVCRARSDAEFIAKLGIVIEEADESEFWMEVLVEAGFVPLKRLAPLIKEAGELVAICVAARETTRRRTSKIKDQNSKIATA